MSNKTVDHLIQLQAEQIRQLKEALQPFVRAADEVPAGCRSRLRVFDGCSEDG